ncbi:MAG TPA: aminoacyl-tRNA deacylase [Candidatus Sulfomarinibacteraceae bacterium]|nr:aminoacyl-tRNA deacylase [Candidatus Sulfomarinibacteraceae bacterium]
MQKTLAMRLLEGKGVPYEAVTYPEDERDAEVVASHLGASPSQVFKTLVVVRERGKPFLTMVPADRQLDLKKMAKEVGEKKLNMASHEEAERMTRLEVGGISPLALINRGFDIVLDTSAQQYDEIYISAGEKGINIRVPVSGLVDVTGATYLDVSGE